MEEYTWALGIPLAIIAFSIQHWFHDTAHRTESKVRIQELKTEEARELRLKAEAESNKNSVS